MTNLKTFLAVIAVIGTTAVLAPAAHAQLLGASVTGQLEINGSTTNYFDPANGFVPNGYLNKTFGPTVTISNPAVEYGFSDSANLNTADFTNNTLNLTDVSNGGSVPTKYVFTSSAFTGLPLSQLSNTFPNGGANVSLVGDVLTIQIPTFPTSGTYIASFSFGSAAVPEPGSLALLVGLGPVALLAIRRMRRQAV